MADTASTEEIPLDELDRAYATIMRSIVETTQAPHYAELAPMLGIEVERARRMLHELCGMERATILHLKWRRIFLE